VGEECSFEFLFSLTAPFFNLSYLIFYTQKDHQPEEQVKQGEGCPRVEHVSNPPMPVSTNYPEHRSAAGHIAALSPLLRYIE